MADAATEMHLLREAEMRLGALIWKNVEKIDALSVEYWNLRKLVKEHARLTEEISGCEKQLEAAHERRVSLLAEAPGAYHGLRKKREETRAELKAFALQRDQIVTEAREIRRNFEGLKMKLEVLEREVPSTSGHADDVAVIMERLKGLKERFELLRSQREELRLAMEALERERSANDGDLATERAERRTEASGVFQIIGDHNKQLSTLKAESSVVAAKMRQLHGEIGRHISRNMSDPACAASGKSQRSLIDVMRALRKSIEMNHKLAENF